jgi:hypothetical protein
VIAAQRKHESNHRHGGPQSRLINVRCLPDIVAPELHFTLPRYYFKLVDDPLFANYGVHGLEDDTAARVAGIELARSVRQARPRVVGQLFDA